MTLIQFLDIAGGAPSLHSEDRIALLCTAIVSQQSAGFKNVVDARQFSCAACASPGFNFGWGAVHYTCGAEILSDGEYAVLCPSEAAI